MRDHLQGLFDQTNEIDEQSVVRVVGEHDRQSDQLVGSLVVAQPGMGRPEVREVDVEAAPCRSLLGRGLGGEQRLGEPHGPAGVTLRQLGGAAVTREMTTAVGAEELEHAVGRRVAVVQGHQRAVDEVGERSRHGHFTPGDGGDGGQLDRSDEGGHGDEELALRVREQADGPLDHIKQRAVTFGAAPAVEDAERLVERIAQATQSESGNPCGGELEHQRETVETTNDLGDDVGAGRRVHVRRRDGLETVEEQPSRVILGERREDDDVLIVDAHRHPAGEQDVDEVVVGDPVGDDRDSVGEVLAVVEHDQHASSGERIGDLVQQRLTGCHGQPQITGHHGRDVGGVAEGAELDPDDAVHVPVTYRVCGVAGQPSLADTSRTDDGDETVHGEQLGDALQVVVSADERAARQRPHPRPDEGRGGWSDREIPREGFWLGPCVADGDRAVERQEIGARVEADIAHSGMKDAVDAMGLGLATGGVQRHHQLAHEPWPTRLTGDQALQLGNRFGVIAEAQQPLESLLSGDQTELVEPFHLGARPPLPGEVEVRAATPDAQRTLVHRDRRSTRLTPSCGKQPLEVVGVDAADRGVELIARFERDDGPIPQRPPQPGDIRVHRRHRIDGTVLAGPQRLDEPVDRHHTAPVRHQHREQTTLLLAAERDRAPVVDHVHRAKHTELHDGTPRDPDFTSGGTEIWGRCHHLIVPGSGTGGLQDVTGQLVRTDISTDASIGRYRGFIRQP